MVKVKELEEGKKYLTGHGKEVKIIEIGEKKIVVESCKTKNRILVPSNYGFFLEGERPVKKKTKKKVIKKTRKRGSTTASIIKVALKKGRNIKKIIKGLSKGLNEKEERRIYNLVYVVRSQMRKAGEIK